jgi:hypothetical protein
LKKTIRIQFRNGLFFHQDVKNILSPVADEYDFVDSNNPDFVIFGPYGNDLPPPGNYTRIGYFCENIRPDFGSCEWAFGIPREEETGKPNYHRIQWHGINPASLLKQVNENEIDRLVSRAKFCNFLYSNPAPYREAFFKRLSRYKRIDAPGKSMNNMPSLAKSPGGRWEQKRNFLAEYKFTIAFENDVYPGYQTEKLYDPMQAMSIPIYCGDPFIGEIFDTSAFFNLESPRKLVNPGFLNGLSRIVQQDFHDILPRYYSSPVSRFGRKLKFWGRRLKMSAMISKTEIDDLVDRIVEADRNPDQYAGILRKPWLRNNDIPEETSSRKPWQIIFG